MCSFNFGAANDGASGVLHDALDLGCTLSPDRGAAQKQKNSEQDRFQSNFLHSSSCTIFVGAFTRLRLRLRPNFLRFFCEEFPIFKSFLQCPAKSRDDRGEARIEAEGQVTPTHLLISQRDCFVLKHLSDLSLFWRSSGAISCRLRVLPTGC